MICRHQLVQLTQKFVIDITNFFPKDNLFETYENFVNTRIAELNSKIVGTDEYLQTLVRQGQNSRVPEVLGNQQKDIRKYIAETFIKMESIKDFMNYLEYKERTIIIPKVQEILSVWDEALTSLNNRLTQLSKKF